MSDNSVSSASTLTTSMGDADSHKDMDVGTDQQFTLTNDDEKSTKYTDAVATMKIGSSSSSRSQRLRQLSSRLIFVAPFILLVQFSTVLNLQEFRQLISLPQPQYTAKVRDLHEVEHQATEQHTTDQQTQIQSESKVAEDRSKGPKLIIHLGPAKTATTTFQHDLFSAHKRGILLKDKYAYWGRGGMKASYKDARLVPVGNMWKPECMQRDYTTYMNTKMHHAANATAQSLVPRPGCIQETKDVLDMMREDGVSLITSSEEWSYTKFFLAGGLYQDPLYFKNLKDLLDGWDVTIVVTYRRVFDWMLSTIKQNRGMEMTYHTSKHANWPANGGVPTGNTWEIIQEWMQDSSTALYGQDDPMTMADIFVFIDGLIQTWRHHGFKIHVMNIHSKEQITQQLMCDFISDAPNACEYLRNMPRGFEQNVRNMPWFLYFDIAYEAAKRGVIDTKMQTDKTITQVTNELAEYHHGELKKNIADLPRKCPNEDELNQFLQMSLAKEEQWMPQWYASPDGEAAHRKAFDRTAHEKFDVCSIDMDQLFDGVETWVGLLQKIKGVWQ